MYGTILILPMYVEPAGHTHRKKLQLVCVCVWFEFADICAKYKLIKTKKTYQVQGQWHLRDLWSTRPHV